MTNNNNNNNIGKPPPAPRSLGSLISGGSSNATSHWFGSTTGTSNSTTSSHSNTNADVSTTTTIVHPSSLQQQHRSVSVPVLPEMMFDRQHPATTSTATAAAVTDNNTKNISIPSSSNPNVVLRSPNELGISTTTTTTKTNTQHQHEQYKSKGPTSSSKSKSKSQQQQSQQKELSEHPYTTIQNQRIHNIIHRYLTINNALNCQQQYYLRERNDTDDDDDDDKDVQPPTTMLKEEDNAPPVETKQYQNSKSTSSNSSSSPPPDAVVQMTTLCYRGMEVLIASSCEYYNIINTKMKSNKKNIPTQPTNDLQSTSSIVEQQSLIVSPPPIAYIICPRTHFVYQTLVLDSNSTSTDVTDAHQSNNKNTNHDVYIISIQSHSNTGQICIALSNHIIVSYIPKQNHPKHHLYGKYHWICNHQRTIYYHQYFFPNICSIIATNNTSNGSNNSNNNYTENERNDLSSSKNYEYHNFDMCMTMNYMVLVAYQNQLAVFDTTPLPASLELNANRSDAVASPFIPSSTVITTSTVVGAELVWMTRVSNIIRTAKISGDSYSIAVILERRRRRRHGGRNKSNAQNKDNMTNSKDDINDDDDDDDDDDAATDGIHTYEREYLPTATSNSYSFADDNTSSTNTEQQQKPTNSNHDLNIGIYYKPGPFLVHTAPVSYMSFRGYGNLTSSMMTSHKGQNGSTNNNNDLLLTYCAMDNTARLYGQNSWNPLTEWKTSPNSSSDYDTFVGFIDCASALTIGDIMPPPAATTKINNETKSSTRHSRSYTSPMNENSHESNTSTMEQSSRIQFPTIPNHFPIPSTHAGAWIYELMIPSFKSYEKLKNKKNADATGHILPFIRISRLTYLERGIDDLNPTILECISSYIPQSSCFYIPKTKSKHDSNHPNKSTKFSVQGIWPAWNPFLSIPSSEASDLLQNENRTPTKATTITNDKADATISGSAMSYLGLLSGPTNGVANHQSGSTSENAGYYFGAHGSLGGTQCPPCEIRITAAHDGTAGNISILDFAIYGDSALTEVTIGDPIRHVLSIADMNERNHSSLILKERHRTSVDDRNQNGTNIRRISIKSSMTYDTTSRLIAKVHNNYKTISITMQKPGSMSYLPENWLPDDVDPARATAILQHSSKYVLDKSLIPVPLSLHSVRIPSDDTTNASNDSNAQICVVLWWPDYKQNGSPILVAILNTGTVILFEIPPPYCTSELTIPDHGSPVAPSVSNDLHGLVPSQSYDNSLSSADDNDYEGDGISTEFDVAIIPDPEFGLGLRLESPPDGNGAFVGSFKRHPLLGDSLPAEKSGRIEIGDILLSANGTDLDKKPFDDIVTAVREVGSSCGPGNPIRMRFRRSIIPKNKTHRAFTVNSARKTSDSNSIERRSMEQMLGVNPGIMKRRFQHPTSDQEPVPVTSQQRRENSLNSTDGILGQFPNVVHRFDRNDKNDAIFKVVAVDRHVTASVGCRGALLISGNGNSIVVNLLFVPFDIENANAECIFLSSLAFSNTSGTASVCAIQIVEAGSSWYSLVACTQDGQVQLITMALDASVHDIRESKIILQNYVLFTLPCPWNTGSVIKAYSSSLLATLQPDPNDPGLSRTIRIWSIRPDPGVFVDSSEELDNKQRSENNYYSSEVYLEPSSDEDLYCDFDFLCPGTLDAFPSLVAFSRKHATLFKKEGNCEDWVPAVRISYDTDILDCPEDIFSHLSLGLKSIYSSQDEKMILRSDWHPICLLSTICSSVHGPKIALLKHVRPIILWLCSDKGLLSGSFPVIPLIIHCIPATNESVPESHCIMDALTAKPLENAEDATIRKCLDTLYKIIISRNASGAAAIQNNEDPSISSIVSSMSINDLRSLWILAGMVLETNMYDGLDTKAQLLLFSVTFFDRWRELLKNIPPQTSGKRLMPAHGVLVRGSSTIKESDTMSIASAGAMAALLSSDQELLMRSIRVSTQRISWSFVRERRIVFWERSDVALAVIAEEIGSAMFLESRDVMECSLFYIISRKITTLQNLARSDQSHAGRTFSKFLSDYDFSSDRGRRAAEKNAFSLLRKCRYQVAAAFFLLANPPFLNAALETIATKMDDMDLAFFVARLTESTSHRQAWPQRVGFGGVLGGGGGYAGGGNDVDDAKRSHFREWKPKLGFETRKLLIERILPSVSEDNIMTALCFVWINKKQEASWFISRIVDVKYGGVTKFGIRNDANQSFFQILNQRKDAPSLSLTNVVVNFCSAVTLLNSLGASCRAIMASSLVMSKALCSLGCELSSMQSLLDFSDPKDLEKIEQGDLSNGNSAMDTIDYWSSGSSSILNVKTQGMKESQQRASDIAVSSIFDDYSLRPEQPVNPKSIFDDFDVQPPQRQSTVVTATPISNYRSSSNSAQSSIFDNNVVEMLSIQKSKIVPTKVSDFPDSSIFDNFVGPPSTQHLNTTSALKVQSSIDIVAPVAAPMQSSMHSSIFDDYDTPHVVKTSTSQITGANDHQTTSMKVQYDSANAPKELQLSLEIENIPTPKVWFEWRKSIVLEAVSRRLIREVASVVQQFQGDIHLTSVWDFYQRHDNSGASEILLVHCDYPTILGNIKQSFEELLVISKLDPLVVVEHSRQLLGSSHDQRLLLLILLYAVIQRDDLAEDILIAATSRTIENCNNASILYDDASQKLRTIGYLSTLRSRHEAAKLSWQIESCLWLHRGGGLQLSYHTVKECILAVRIGFLYANWKRGFDCIEAMILNEPDCILDDKAGQQVWSSLKDPYSGSKSTDSMQIGDGWEFLVECKRSQATELLRDASSGCFLIRPNPNDDGVFTLSFKTNLEAAEPDASESTSREEEIFTPDTSADEMSDLDTVDKPRRVKKKKVRKEDVVQHAIIRVSESGFRCGSFGPFTSLMALLETVSSSLPFQLRFDLPPKYQVAKEQKRQQTSPNAIFLRKLSLHKSLSPFADSTVDPSEVEISNPSDTWRLSDPPYNGEDAAFIDQLSIFGIFSQVVMLALLRRQLSSIAAYHNDDIPSSIKYHGDGNFGADGLGSSRVRYHIDDIIATACRFLRPLLTWCRTHEMMAACDLLSKSYDGIDSPAQLSPVNGQSERSDKVTADSLDAIEVSPIDMELRMTGGDTILRGMIRQGSGVEFSTLRLLDSGECTMLVLFSRQEAIRWLIASGVDETDESATYRLDKMEKMRYIESVKIPFKLKSAETMYDDVRYRFVDPWEVEPLGSCRDGEVRHATLGRERYVSFNLGQISSNTESTIRCIGGHLLMEVWVVAGGDALLTKAIAAFHPPWEKCCIGDLQLTNGKVTEPPPFVNSIRRCLFRNALFRRLDLPQRFIAMIRVELLDLKNLTTPGGSLSLTAYALLRLKRIGSSGTLTNKARTIDSASTIPIKLNKTSGPNAPASWGSVVRFRFPLPDDGESGHSNYAHKSSSSSNRETLFNGPPRVLQISVYEKKILSDHALGSADVSIDGLSAGGQIEEWVPLRNEKHGTITWFTRIRVSLRFDIMNIAPAHLSESQIPPSVGLQRIYELTHNKSNASVHEDVQHRSMSVTDLNGMEY